MSGLYLILIKDTNYIKIGKTKNIKKRLSTLQVSLPSDLVLLYYGEDKGNLERELHDLVATKNTRGEWFELSEEDLLKISHILNLTPLEIHNIQEIYVENKRKQDIKPNNYDYVVETYKEALKDSNEMMKYFANLYKDLLKTT